MDTIRFQFTALNAQGDVVTGEIIASNVQEAVAEVEARGLTLRSIARGSMPAAEPSPRDALPMTASFRPEEFDATAEQDALRSHMQQVLNRAAELLPGLRAYAQELTNHRERRELQNVIQLIEQGSAAAAVKSLSSLPGYWIPLLSAASQTRDPGRLLRDFLEETQRTKELQRQWWLALAYPVFLVVLAGIVMVGLSFVVVPVYSKLFNDFQIELPWLTRTIVRLAEAVVSGRVVLAVLFVFALGLLVWKSRYFLPKRWREAIADNWSLRFGRSSALARFSRFAADLLEAELAPQVAVRVAGIATANGSLQRASRHLAAALEQENIDLPPNSKALLTKTIRSALQSPLPNPTRVALLREVSQCYAQRVRNRLSWTRGLVEPLAICLVGLMVAVTALALFMPLIRLTTGLM